MWTSTLHNQVAAAAASSSQLPDNPWPVLIWSALLLVVLGGVAAAAAIANHFDDLKDSGGHPRHEAEG